MFTLGSRRTVRFCRGWVNSCRSIAEIAAFDGDWHAAWKAAVTPWDTGTAAPPLKKLIESGSIAPSVINKSKALVPGCGSGYECLYLADAGYHVVGLDISDIAVTKTKTLLKKRVLGSVDRTEVICVDFFKHDGQYAIVFDYTFFCALKPPMRSAWAEKMFSLLEPKGELITLMFPVDKKAPKDVGPPFPVSPEDYKQVLEAVGFSLIYLKPCDDSIRPRMGREWIGRWVKKSEGKPAKHASHSGGVTAATGDSNKKFA